MDNKKEYGQFMTTNYKYILQRFEIPKSVKKIVEPFCGKKDLLNFIKKDKYEIECYDIEPQDTETIQRDTLLEPPVYKGKYILTNPPYLALNKSKNKEIYIKYGVDDLYKCFIKETIINIADGGIIIIPLNFLSSVRKSDIELRKDFLNIYDILKINIFEEKVFEDTGYSVCSIQFEKRKLEQSNINILIYPREKEMNILLNNANNYTIGGEIYMLCDNEEYKITRLTKNNIEEKNTNIMVRCIDNNKKDRIRMYICDDNELYVDDTENLSARTFATLVITPKISMDRQKILVKRFNKFLELYREEYMSLFLTNYREASDIARKRISFDLVYKIIGFLMKKI